MDMDDVRETVQSFYKKRVTVKNYSSNPHCENFKNMLNLPKAVKDAVVSVHCDIIKNSFSCGSPFPPDLEGCRIVDLGCGTGKDCYAFSKLVGEHGHVTGVDMLPEMIDFASRYTDYHAEKFGYRNVEFKHGYLEELEASASFSCNSFDVVTSNCVITLCPDKKKVYQSAFNVLRGGGEMFFSDVYAAATIPDHVKNHDEAFNEGFGGAVVWEDFVSIVRSIGFLGPFVVSSKSYDPFNDELKNIVGEAKYFSRTVRLIKPDPTTGTDFAAGRVTYLGTIQHYENEFSLDHDHTLKAHQTTDLPEDFAQALRTSRYAKHFRF